MRLTRRGLVGGAAATGGLMTTGAMSRVLAQAPALIAAPALVSSAKVPPQMPAGVQAGDVLGDRAVIWSRTDRPARMRVELSTTESFKDSWLIPGPAALEDTDFTAKLDVAGLPLGQRMFYRVSFLDFADLKTASEPVTGSFVTPPATRRDVRLIWTGDVAGQGWGINPDFGGMRIHAAMRARRPDIFIHSGDTIYADGPIAAEVKLDDGTVWRNLVTEAKSKPAETLAEFRGNHAYNLMDDNVRAFTAPPSAASWSSPICSASSAIRTSRMWSGSPPTCTTPPPTTTIRAAPGSRSSPRSGSSSPARPMPARTAPTNSMTRSVRRSSS